jgi:hypothetical protein
MWNSTTVADGTHTIVAKSTDQAGNVGSATTTVTTKNSTADTTSPTVSLTSPASGATLAGTVGVGGTATDNMSVSKVDILKDGVILTTVTPTTGGAYAYSWDTTAVPNGTHTLVAKAYDPSGNAGTSASVSVNVNNVAADTVVPTTSITAPANGAKVSGTTNVTATATDNVGVVRVELYEDGTLQTTDTTAPYGWSWDTTLDVDGTHSIQTKAYDAAGNVGVSPIISVNVANTVSVNTTPVVTITSPASGAKIRTNGATNISATASSAAGIYSIVLSLDGKTIQTCLSATSCSASVNNKNISVGQHTITATAVNKAGTPQTGTASVTITK